MLFGLLVADLGHLWSVKVLGSEVYWKFESWNAIDWGNIGFVYLGAFMRSSFLLGLGVKTVKIPVPTSEKIKMKPTEDVKPKSGASELLAGLDISLTGFEDCTSP